MARVLLSQFEDLIRDNGSAALGGAASILCEDDRFVLHYIPFEHVNELARLVIVGITPGPNQLDLAYAHAQRLLRAHCPQAEVLRETKRIAGFGGDAMRPNLLRMLRHFGFAEILEVADENELWDTRSDLLHSTSVVPHAAFWRDGTPFAGSFSEVRASPALRTSFEQDFVATLPMLSRDALFVGLGPTPVDALKWCSTNGFLREEQIIGGFAHTARTAGSQVSIYLHERRPEDLHPRDPVRHRLNWLLSAYAEVALSISKLRDSPSVVTPPIAAVTPINPEALATDFSQQAETEVIDDNSQSLNYVVKRGKGAGTVLTPHKHEDGTFVVSPTRFEADYIRLSSIKEAVEWARKGYSVRMSNPGSETHRSPSLISPSSIKGV